MNKIAVIVAVLAAPFLLAATPAAGNLYGRFNDGVYLAPGKLFKMSARFRMTRSSPMAASRRTTTRVPSPSST